jgi:hypothetical protein
LPSPDERRDRKRALLVSREPANADYTVLAHCISEARYQHPLDDEHQELVNAMYACGIYKLAAGYAAGAP